MESDMTSNSQTDNRSKRERRIPNGLKNSLNKTVNDNIISMISQYTDKDLEGQ